MSGCLSPLNKAIQNNRAAEVSQLLKNGADVNEPSMESPLYRAVRKNRTEVVKILLENGADVNKGVSNGWKPIHLAVDVDNAQIVRWLIEKGVNIHVKNAYGETPLDIAERKGSAEIVKMLMEVDQKNFYSNNDQKKTSNSPIVAPSDVDVDVPVCNSSKANTYALIIGNEDYSSFQTGLSTEVNVDYAVNDAKVFMDYCVKTLGVPERQIKLLTNATVGQMREGIIWINNLARVENGKAELIFYYSGHGLPDEQNREPYLIPVDVSGNNITLGVKLAEVYDKLTEYPSKRVFVFLDACFSGGARNQGLVTMKGVKVRPKMGAVNGNMVVLASSTGEESSGVYREKQHGFMTYFLLRELKETKGAITIKELSDFVIESVTKETALKGKVQTPQLNFSPTLQDNWLSWEIK
ncbi:hypothetical protein CYCD_01090 [Tenuifilaceae bacterium CYCD]|nr:hypothetical protein CYCD_01090 [Tenuifilaceae bacterium CYCD]